jgi:hypothetical protein
MGLVWIKLRVITKCVIDKPMPQRHPEVEVVMQSNALAFEYQRDYVAARRDLNVFDLVNDPTASGKCCILGLGFPEKSFDDLLAQLRSFGNDATDSLLVAENV